MKRILCVLLAGALAVNANANSLPAGWSEVDFPELDEGNSWSVSPLQVSGTWTITTCGDDIWSDKDIGTFIYMPISGDVTITAHIASLGDSDPWAKAGVMIRQNTSAQTIQNCGANAFCAGTVANGTTFQYRPNTGTQSTGNNPANCFTVDDGESGTSVPCWVRLTRTGSQYYAYRSTDGVTWTAMAGSPQSGINITDPCWVGLCVSSHQTHISTTAVIDNVSVTGGVGNGSLPYITSLLTANGMVSAAFSYQITATNHPTSFNATGLPSGLSVNTGSGLISGIPTATGITYVTISAVNTAGTSTATLTLNITPAPLPAENPGSVVNGLNYKYYIGDGSWTNVPAFNTLTPSATGTVANFDISLATVQYNYAFKFYGYINVPSDGVYTFYTDSDDGSMLYIGGYLVVNNDGLHGVEESSGSIALDAGLHSIVVGYLQNTYGATLTNSYSGPGISRMVIPNSVLYRPSGGGPSLTVSITSPLSGASFIPGTNITISASASDTSGTVTKVEFYYGSVKIGQDTSSPYSYVWSNVGAGSYNLTAVAYDSYSTVVTSAVVSITVSANSGSVCDSVRFWPRDTYASRMVGGVFQGSNDGTNYTTLVTISVQPTQSAWTTLTFANSTAYRYLRYLSPSGGYGNVCEIEFYAGATKLTGTGFGTAGSWGNDGDTFDMALDGNTSTYFDGPVSDGVYVGIDLGVGVGGGGGGGSYAVITEFKVGPADPGSRVLSWSTVSGRTYGIQTTTDLSGTWTNVSNSAYTNLVGTGAYVVYTNTSASAVRFFRIKMW